MTRRNNGIGLVAILASLAFAACGPADVSVVVALGDDTESTPLDNVEVQILPYDRDQVFDSLEAEAPTPEPAIPADLLAAREEIAQAQQNWLDLETRWGTLRDTLQRLNSRLEELNPGEGLYRAIFNEWQDLEAELNRAERQRDGAFNNFNDLQQAAIERMDSMRIVQADWADQAFVDVSTVIMAKLDMTGLDIVVDTTDASGIADFQDGVAPGMYWVHARHELPYDELYWNVPVTVSTEAPLVLRLSRDNAEVRPIF